MFSIEWNLASESAYSLNESILCTVNIQHRCDAHKCTASGSEYVVQERQRTSHTRPIMVHEGDLDDLVLNTAKMRDVKHIQQLWGPLVPLNMDRAIEEGAAQEMDSRKSARQATSNSQGSLAVNHARGRGTRQGSALANSPAHAR